ncbi:MAG: ABC transporter substrate-binding protein [Deltaproteobacteria bacterium]|jgi:phospholipid transport system substrate-binding protein|nr:ABC transporter substrate-binding protein [Deltaproteobacteria bacterium]
MRPIIIPTLIGAIYYLLVFWAASPVWAQAPSEARQALEKTVNLVLEELNKPEIKNSATRAQEMDKVEEIMAGLFSFEELSLRTVGPNWKNFNDDQKTRFINEFRRMLRSSYANTFEEYDGEVLNYVGETPQGNQGDRVQIDTTVLSKGKQIPISFRMINKNAWKVYDIVIENISLVQNYRSQFQSLLQKGDIEGLIKSVSQKADEFNQKNKIGQ